MTVFYNKYGLQFYIEKSLRTPSLSKGESKLLRQKCIENALILESSTIIVRLGSYNIFPFPIFGNSGVKNKDKSDRKLNEAGQV